MKYLKMLGLAAVAALGLMAFVGAGTASATVLCSTTTTPCNSKWPVNTVMDWSLKSGTSAKLTTTEGTTLDTCTESTVKGSITNAGSATTTVSGSLSALTWGQCLVTTDTTKLGSLEVHWKEGDNGTVTAKETEVTVNTGLFGSCVFTAGAGIDLGTLTGGEDPVLDVNAVVRRVSGLCPETAKWVAEYTLTEPTKTPLYVRAE